MVKDLGIPADSETVKAEAMTDTTKTATTTATVHSIEAATTARWLASALAPARARAKQAPSEDAVDRIRMRVFGEPAAKKRERSIAA
jgi:hypothetical protein